MTNRSDPISKEEDALLDAVGTAFSRLRRRAAQVNVDPPISRKDLSRNLLINLVDEAAGKLTVGAVAEQLAVDPSVASRMVADGISAGFLVREASQRDGRKTVLRLTLEGIALRDRFRQQQRQAFEYITREWPDDERLQLARLLLKYADSTSKLNSSEKP